MKASTVIHIGTLNIHAASTGALLESLSRDPVNYVDGNSAVALPGIIIDAERGLMWAKDTNAKDKTWAEAKQAAADVRLGGFTDWRLPTRQELLTLVDDTRSNPAIDTQRFECASDWYWTSTPLASSPSVFAWFVGFSDGDAVFNHQLSYGRVRAVRSVSPASPGQ